MANEKRTVRYGIKGKLISAIAMLMVAVIMTVSSTYAWFTLSTAPEVTGISTAVGANGALEMVLLSKNEDGSWSYTTGADVYGDKNTTWGNLVDLSNNAYYGTDKIVLYPSALNTELGEDKININSPLNYPKYGFDGRVDSVTGTTMLGGNYKENGSFKPNEDYGFRAVGTTSGLSEREVALRDATSKIYILKNQARDAAEAALKAHGAVLADMAVQKVMRDDPTFGTAEYAAVAGMIDGLEATLVILDEAYQQAILAWAASKYTSPDNDEGVVVNTAYNAVKAIVEDNDQYADFTAVRAAVEANFTTWEAEILTLTGKTVTLALPDWLVGASLTQFNQMADDVETADSTLAGLDATDDEYTYAELSGALRPLVNMDKLKVNDIDITDEDGNTNKDAIMSSALNNKAVWVSMSTGTGVFADVADQCGNYQVSIQVDAGALLGASSEIMMDAAMLATTTLNNPYLQEAIDQAKAAGAPKDAAGETSFSEFYGYIVDLGFRTNAAASNLLLQQEAIDRIYEDNNNDATMGHGSSMTFTSTSTGFSTESVKGLMEHIRIVFFDTEGPDNTIYAFAKLDTANATVSGGSVTATMYLYETVTAYVVAEVENVTVYENGGKYYLDAEFTEEVSIVEGSYADGTATVKNMTVFRSEPTVTTTGEGDAAVTTTTYSYYTEYYTQDDTTFISTVSDDALNAAIAATAKRVEVVKEDGIITALTQNRVHHVSALVYLDGATIENADVAADAAASMTGTANFQFSSDAALDPMDYGDLYHPDGTEGTEATGAANP